MGLTYRTACRQLQRRRGCGSFPAKPANPVLTVRSTTLPSTLAIPGMTRIRGIPSLPSWICSECHAERSLRTHDRSNLRVISRASGPTPGVYGTGGFGRCSAPRLLLAWSTPKYVLDHSAGLALFVGPKLEETESCRASGLYLLHGEVQRQDRVGPNQIIQGNTMEILSQRCRRWC